MNLCNVPGKVRRNQSCKLRIMIKMNVFHASTLVTGKVTVGSRISIESVRSVTGKLLDLSQLGQKRQISVYRSKTDIGELLSYMSIYRVGSRMIVSCHQEFFNTFPLPAFFQCCHRCSFLFKIDNCYCYQYTSSLLRLQVLFSFF